jgi:hypothetical protein
MKTRRSPRTGLLILIAIGVGGVLAGRAQAYEDSRGGSLVAHSAPAEVADAPACRSRSDCGPRVMGGLQITSTGWSCTSGFMARATETGALYILTAGHCLAGSGLSALWSHHGAALGRATVEAFRSGSNADVGAFEVTGSGRSNEIYGPNNDDIRSVSGVASNSSQTVGSEVCRSAVTSGWRCGSIVAADVDTTIQGKLIHHTWWTDFPSAGGDSGSPVLDHDGRAAGIVIATTPTQTVYSTVDWISTELHIRPCINWRCE